MVHKNIVRLYEYTETEDGIYLYMEECNDPTFFETQIEDYLNEIEDEEILKGYCLDILRGLYYCHSLGIIHGDVKIQNCLMHRENG